MCKSNFKVVKVKIKGGQPPCFVVYPNLSVQTLLGSFFINKNHFISF
jgi:hypothetical protein